MSADTSLGLVDERVPRGAVGVGVVPPARSIMVCWRDLLKENRVIKLFLICAFLMCFKLSELDLVPTATHLTTIGWNHWISTVTKMLCGAIGYSTRAFTLTTELALVAA